MDTIKVTARQDIRTTKGAAIALEGDRGVVVPDCRPVRKRHRGLVPVRWEQRKRVFWVPKEVVRAREDLEAFITPPIVKAEPIDLPDCKDIDDFDFGCNLRTLRQVCKMSQAVLAKAMSSSEIQVSQTSISNWERRKDSAPGVFLAAASRALGVPQFVFFLKLDCDTAIKCLDYLSQLQETVCRKE